MNVCGLFDLLDVNRASSEIDGKHFTNFLAPPAYGISGTDFRILLLKAVPIDRKLTLESDAFNTLQTGQRLPPVQ